MLLDLRTPRLVVWLSSILDYFVFVNTNVLLPQTTQSMAATRPHHSASNSLEAEKKPTIKVEPVVVKKEKQEPPVKLQKARVMKKGASVARRGGRRELEVSYVHT